MANRIHYALVIRTLILAVLIALLIILSSLFWPRFLYQEGITQLKLKQYDKAIHHLARAEKKIPQLLSGTFARADMYRIYTNYGQALYHSGIQDWREKGPSIRNYTLLRKGKIYLSKADVISPITYRNSYWLTLTEEALEKLHQGLFPKLKNPYDAYVFYQKTFPLRPAGSAIRYAYIRYLNFKKRDNEIPAAVQNLMAIYPPAYYQLKKEPFYSENLISRVEKGLTSALENGVLPRTAAKALSDLYVRTGNPEKGVAYFNTYLSLEPTQNSYTDYIRLGSLCLDQGLDDQGNDAFINALETSGSRAIHALNRIYGLFKKQNKHERFLSFLPRISEKTLSRYDRDLAAAQCHMDMDDSDQAREILNRLAQIKEKDRVFYMLTLIARQEKNWEQMELATQKAVRLAPSNAGYHYLFAQALASQKKYVRAEAAVTDAIKAAHEENPWYYHFRASMRWALKHYKGAVTDWENAFALKPDRADFAYRLALGHRNLGQFDKALVYIKKALALAPGNATYKTFLKRLETQ